MFPLLYCRLINGLQSLQEVHAPARACLEVAVPSGVCLWQYGLSTGCSVFRGVTSFIMEHYSYVLVILFSFVFYPP